VKLCVCSVAEKTKITKNNEPADLPNDGRQTNRDLDSVSVGGEPYVSIEGSRCYCR
jgi:hypothetical protein